MTIRLLSLLALAVRPAPEPPVDHRDVGKNAKTVLMSFDKRDLAEVIQFVSQFTQRNFILPERISGKITILSNAPIPAEEVWSVFLAALDANNWAIYPVGSYWKLTEKKQSSRAVIPTYLDNGQETPPTEQMVTKLFKLKFLDADTTSRMQKPRRWPPRCRGSLKECPPNIAERVPHPPPPGPQPRCSTAR
jgi:type II secretory pathway component GspD/PulD (secretin)